jgi:hypothetical protein
MADKQEYLQEVIPDLLARFTTPDCFDDSGNAIVASGVVVVSDPNGNCAQGHPRFPPVLDIHAAVVTSSLGGRGVTSLCQTMATPGATPADYEEFTGGSWEVYTSYILDGQTTSPNGLDPIPKNNDDEAHLVNRTVPPTSPDALPSQLGGSFLAWTPSAGIDVAPASAVAEPDLTSLGVDLQEMIVGAGSFGCGIESQLESWYRFLIQPDPYASITTTTNADGLHVASWQGVDTTILQQRHDFLRPDSAVLIVVLSDENDSEIDVRSIAGAGVNFLDDAFEPPRGTTECAANPGSSSCMSCAFQTAPPGDANCEAGAYPRDDTNWAVDDNLRHVHMKQKYGVDAQFPILRYVAGLTSQKVPSRTGEYPTNGDGYYQGGLNDDPADLNCTTRSSRRRCRPPPPGRTTRRSAPFRPTPSARPRATSFTTRTSGACRTSS